MGATPIGPTLSIANQLLIGRYQTMLSSQAASTIHQLRAMQLSRQEAQTLEARSEPRALEVVARLLLGREHDQIIDQASDQSIARFSGPERLNIRKGCR